MTGIVIAAIVALIVGLAGGFFLGILYVRKQMEQMQNDPKMIQEMAKKMGVSLNRQQMNKARQMMNKGKFK